jgi:hypothetical protein
MLGPLQASDIKIIQTARASFVIIFMATYKIYSIRYITALSTCNTLLIKVSQGVGCLRSRVPLKIFPLFPRFPQRFHHVLLFTKLIHVMCMFPCWYFWVYSRISLAKYALFPRNPWDTLDIYTIYKVMTEKRVKTVCIWSTEIGSDTGFVRTNIFYVENRYETCNIENLWIGP